MFENKKDADSHDKMLELAEQFTHLLESQIKDINESDAEAFGLLLAKNKELIALACKGKPDALTEIGKPQNVTSISDAVNT
jgi:dsDNA-binding SOS-regulon protein